MKTLLSRNISFFLILSLAIFATSCADSVASQLKKSVEEEKAKCPVQVANGVVMLDANFYESDKIIEYTGSIEGIESLDAATISNMKAAIVKSLKDSGNAFDNMSVKMISQQYGYIFRYIYKTTGGKKLCQIDITKDDLK